MTTRRANVEPKQIEQHEKTAAQLGKRVTSVMRDAKAAADAPPPQDPKLRAAYEREVAKLLKTAKKLDSMSSDANEFVVRAFDGVNGEALDRDYKKWVDLGGRVVKAFKAVDEGGTGTHKAVQRMAKSAKSKPKPAAKGKKPDGKKSAQQVRQMQHLQSQMANVITEVERLSKAIRRGLGL